MTQPARHDRHTATPIVSLPFRRLGGQPPFQPDELDHFLSEARIATLSYVRADGRPNQTPLWYDYTVGQMRFVATTGSAKHRALQRDPHVSVIVQDDRPPYRAVIIDGTIDLIDLGTDGTLSQRMAVRYFGEPGAVEYERLSRARRQRDGETLLQIVPTEVKGFDNTHMTSEALLRSLDNSGEVHVDQ